MTDLAENTQMTVTQNRDEQDKQLDEYARRLFTMADIAERSLFSRRLGMQFDGNRDLYSTFGYVPNPAYQDYRNLYERQGISTRIVEKFAQDTWATPAILIDGEARSDKQDDNETPFIKEWNALVKRLRVYQVFKQADIMLGFSRYSIIFLGVPGEFKDPAPNSNLLYIMPYDENAAQIAAYIQDQRDPKFGMPQTYNVNFNTDQTGISIPAGSVHFTRVIHIAENKLSSRVYGRPRLQNLINRLFDIEKVTGGGAEAVWLSLIKGFILTSKDGAGLPEEGTAEAKKLDEAVRKFYNRMQRYAVLENVDVHDLGNASPSVRDTFDVLIEDICGTVGISQRILLGSERGQLASDQDKKEWNQVITSRRTDFAEPEILRPFVDWCISHKIIPAPSSKDYSIQWQDVYPMTLIEKVDYANKLATGANTMTGGMPEQALDMNEWRVTAGLQARTEQEQTKIDNEIAAEEQKKLKAIQDQKAAQDPKGAAAGGNRNGKKPAPFTKAKQNYFPDHEGRPGLRGGSLPAGAGGETLADQEKFVDNAAQNFGFDSRNITALPTRGPMFTVNGHDFETAAAYYPESGEIVVYQGALQGQDENVKRGIIAHEVQHDRFNHFKKRLEADNKKISQSVQSANKAEWLIKADGSLNDFVNPDLLPAYVAYEKYLSGDGFKKLQKTDGVTDYSRAYWDEYNSKGGDWSRPVNETLSEIANLQTMTGGNVSGIDKNWIGLYRSINKLSQKK